MKPILFVGDSHLSRLEKAYSKLELENAVFFITPGPIASLVDFVDGSLTIHEDRQKLREDPRADQHDFIGWLDITIRRLKRIKDTTGFELSAYSSVVIVSYQYFNPEIWARPALAYSRGEISLQVWNKHCENCFCLEYTTALSHHCRILDRLSNTPVKPKIYSVATPARSAANVFPKNLLRSNESGYQAFRDAEKRYAKLTLDQYGSELIPYPDSLLSEDGICTSAGFQHAENDYTHLNLAGSEIWMKEIISYIKGGD